MAKHDFTPVQSEQILDALAELIGTNFNAYSQARTINELCSQSLLSAIDNDEQVFDITPTALLWTVQGVRDLSEFFFKVGDILDSHNAINCALSPDGSKLISKQKES